MSVLLPVHDPDPAHLRAAIASVRAQDHAGWELCIADDGSRDPAVLAVLDEAAADARVRRVRGEGLGIARATEAALALATGDFVTMLDHDDVLAPEALGLVAEAAAPMLFSDEDRIGVGGERRSPYLKGAFDPVLLQGQNSVCHLAAFRHDVLRDAGGMREGFEGAQDHELALRVGGHLGAGNVRHLQAVLYHWRETPGSFSAARAEACREASRRAVAAHAPAGARVLADARLPQWNRVVLGLPDPLPLVSVVGAHAVVGEAGIEVECVARAEEARGAVVVFRAPRLHAEAGWLRELVSRAWQAETGVVGARLETAGGRLRHAGYALDPGRGVVELAGISDAEDPGYRGMFRLPRSVSAVSGEGLAVRREVLAAMGGVDEHPWWDVALCLRAAAAGLRVEWTPHACLRGPGRRRPGINEGFRARHAEALAGERWISPHLRVGWLGLVPRR